VQYRIVIKLKAMQHMSIATECVKYAMELVSTLGPSTITIVVNLGCPACDASRRLTRYDLATRYSERSKWFLKGENVR